MFRFFKYGSVKIISVVFFGIVLLVGTLVVHSYQLRIQSARKSQVSKLKAIGQSVISKIQSRDLTNAIVFDSADSSRTNSELKQVKELLSSVAEFHHLQEPIRIIHRTSEVELTVVASSSHHTVEPEYDISFPTTQNSELGSLANESVHGESITISTISNISNSSDQVLVGVQLISPFQSVLEIEQAKLYDQIIFSTAVLFLIGILMIKTMMATMHKEAVRENKLNLKNTIIERKNHDITASINYAKRLQSAFKPKDIVLQKSFSEFFSINMPKDIIGGDFFWFHDQPSMNLKVVVQADCTGHGVPGAMMSVLGNTLLAEIVIDYDVFDPATILELMNRKLMTLLHQENAESLSDGMDIAVCALNTKTNELTYAAANQSVILIRDNELIQLRGDRNPIGGFHFALDRKFSNKSVKLRRNDMVYMYTDGYQDQFGGEFGKRLKRRGFHNLLLATSANAFSQQRNILLEKFSDWKGAREQVDDVSLLGFEIV